MAAHKSKRNKTKKTLVAARRAAPRKRPVPARPRSASKRKPSAKPKPKAAKAKLSVAKAKPKAAAKAKSDRVATKPPRSQRGARPANGLGGARPQHIPAGPTELDTIKLAYLFRDTSPAAIYHALMNAAEHTMFTGDEAEIEPHVGGTFRSYSGFIQGKTLELVPDARIVQSWRTKHFPKNNPDSTLELTFTPVPEGTRLEMRHLDVPKDQVEYLVTGWVKYYLDPLARHLGKRLSFRPPPM